MILQIPEVFDQAIYYKGISLILWIIAIALLFIGDVLFYLKSRKTEFTTQRKLYIGYSFFFFFFALMRITFIVAVYLPSDYDFYTSLGYILGTIGLIILLFIIETYLVPKTKRIFTLITIVMFSVSLISLIGTVSREFSLTILNILQPIAVLIIFGIYLFIILKGTGEIRTKAIWFLIGLILLFLGHIMDSEMWFTAFPAFPYEIPPIVMIGGIIIILYKQLIKE